MLFQDCNRLRLRLVFFTVNETAVCSLTNSAKFHIVSKSTFIGDLNARIQEAGLMPVI